MLGITQPEKIPLPMEKSKPVPRYVPPPHIGFGSPEDTYASCLSLMPKLPKKNVVRQLVNFPKKLRYSMQMDAVHPEDKDRDFILEYNLCDGTISVHELEKRNSGRVEGAFLKPMLVPKPKTGRDNPEYYTPQDFFIGAKINIFNHYFIVHGADLYVYRYIEANAEKFSRDVRDNVRDYFVKENLLSEDIMVEAKKIQNAEEAAVYSVKPAETTIERNVDMINCLEDFKAQAECKYEGEHGELRPRTPPPEELCPGLVTADNSGDPQGVEKPLKKDIKKEVRWDNRIKY